MPCPFQDYPPSPAHATRAVQRPKPFRSARFEILPAAAPPRRAHCGPWQPKRRVKARTTTTQFSRDCNLEVDRDGTGLGRPFLVRSGGMMMREKWGMAA
jgi:hypothetical protein